MARDSFIGKYVVQEEIARGGMGVIYKAFDPKLEHVVAIKQIHAHLSSDPAFSERFLREARAMARLRDHDNIVTIYSVEEDQQTQFLVMEFFGPGTLRSLLRQAQPIPLRDVAGIGRQMASALAYAHGQGVIHRDIKPANVLIGKRGKAKLTDFGIAAALDEASITTTGQVIGTPEYMSPEQARGVKLDGRSDLYSLGIMLYEMITGSPPYADTSKTAILGKLVFDQHELALQFPPEVPAILQGAVRDLLRRNPDDRIPDAETLEHQLNEILYTLPHTPPATEVNEEVTIAPLFAGSTYKVSPLSAAGPAERSVESATRTRLQPATELRPASSSAGNPVPRRPSPPLEETTILPSGPIPPKHEPSESPVASLSPSPPSSSHSLKPFIGGGIIIVTALGVLVWYLAPQLNTKPTPLPPAVAGPSNSESENNSPDTSTKLAQAEELEKQRRELNQESKRLEDKRRHAEAQQAREEAEGREKERQLAALQRAKDEQEKRKAVQVAKVFPDVQIKSLLEKFKSAYERCDMDTLQLVSRMSERRMNNVEFMFMNYTAFTASIENVTQTEQGASAVLMLKTGTRSNGETIPMSSLSGKYALQIPRQGDRWDKIVW